MTTLKELKRIVRKNRKLEGWDFSHINTGSDPVPWRYSCVVRRFLKPNDRVLDIGTGGGEIFVSLAPYFGEGMGIDHDPAMIKTAKINQSRMAVSNIKLLVMDGSRLKFEENEFDIVLIRHLRVYVSEITRVLRPGGYFITQMVGKQSSKNFMEAFGWTSESFGPDWGQSVDELARQFKDKGCQIIAQGEYDVRYWFKDITSFMFWLMSVPWPEDIKLEKHWKNINRILETSTTERGIETNQHRELLIVQR